MPPECSSTFTLICLTLGFDMLSDVVEDLQKDNVVLDIWQPTFSHKNDTNTEAIVGQEVVVADV